MRVWSPVLLQQNLEKSAAWKKSLNFLLLGPGRPIREQLRVNDAESDTLAVRVLRPQETGLEFVGMFPKVLAAGVGLIRSFEQADVRKGHQTDAPTLLQDLHRHDLRITHGSVASGHRNYKK